MWRALRGAAPKPPKCSDYDTALNFLQSENAPKLLAAVTFIAKRIAVSAQQQSATVLSPVSAFPPVSVLTAVMEHGLNAESCQVRERSLRIILVVYKFGSRPFCWDQCRRAVKRELTEGDRDSEGPFTAALQILQSLPTIEKCMFCCSRDGQACIKSVAKQPDAELRAASIPALSSLLVAAWQYLERSPEGAEGMLTQWVAEDGRDGEIEFTSEEPPRIREDLYLCMVQFYKEAAQGCLGQAPSGDAMTPLPESFAATAGYFAACLQVVEVFIAARGCDGVATWLRDTQGRHAHVHNHNHSHIHHPAAAADVAPYLSVILDTLLGSGDSWDLVCGKANQLLLSTSASAASSSAAALSEAFVGMALVSGILLILCAHVAPVAGPNGDALPFSQWHMQIRSSSSPSPSSPSPSSSSSSSPSSSSSSSSSSSTAVSGEDPRMDLPTMVRSWTRLYLMPLLDSPSPPACRLHILQLLTFFSQADFMASERRCIGALNSLPDAMQRGLVKCLQHTHGDFLLHGAGGAEHDAAIGLVATGVLLLLLHLRENRHEILPHLPIILDSLFALAAAGAAGSDGTNVPASRLVSRVTTELVVFIFTTAGAAGKGGRRPTADVSVSIPNQELRAILGAPCIAQLFGTSPESSAPRTVLQRGREQVAWAFIASSCQVCIWLLRAHSGSSRSDSPVAGHALSPPLRDILSNALLIINKFSNYLSSPAAGSALASGASTGVEVGTVQLVQSCWARLLSALCDVLLRADVMPVHTLGPSSRDDEEAMATAQADLVETLDAILEWHFDDDGEMGPEASVAHAAKLGFLLLVSRQLYPIARGTASRREDVCNVLAVRGAAVLTLLLHIIGFESAFKPPAVPPHVSGRAGGTSAADAALHENLHIAAYVVEEVVNSCASRDAQGSRVLSPSAWVEVRAKAKECLERLSRRAADAAGATAAGECSAALLAVRLKVAGLAQRIDACPGDPPQNAAAAPFSPLAGIEGLGAYFECLLPIEDVLARHFAMEPTPSPATLMSPDCNAPKGMPIIAPGELAYTVVSGSNDLLVLLVATSPIDLHSARLALHVKAINAAGFRLPSFSLSVLVGSAACPQGSGSSAHVRGVFRPVEYLPRGGVAVWEAELCVRAFEVYSLMLRVSWHDIAPAPSMASLGLFHMGDGGAAQGGEGCEGEGGAGTVTSHTLSAPYLVPVVSLCPSWQSQVVAAEWLHCWHALYVGVKNIRVDINAVMLRCGTSASTVVISSHVYGWLLRSAFGDTVALCCLVSTRATGRGTLEIKGTDWRAVEVVGEDIRAVLLALTDGAVALCEGDGDDEEEEIKEPGHYESIDEDAVSRVAKRFSLTLC